MILDGKSIADDKFVELKQKISLLEVKPTLGVILVGKNSPSLRYINQKEKYANKVGINFILKNVDIKISEEELLKLVDEFNRDDSISGFMVQAPLPKHIDIKKIINKIDPKKDVDGSTPENLGKLIIGDESGLHPCTPSGIMDILFSLGVELKGKIVTVLGKSNIVGKPIVSMLINSGATVISCNSNTRNIKDFTLVSDIIVPATGVVGIIKSDMIKENTIIIDVGFSIIEGQIYGDADFNDIINSGKEVKITKVPGGVGPFTVLNLMKNTFKAHCLGKI